MRSNLFDASNAEAQTNELIVAQSNYMVRARVMAGRDIIAQKGAMVAYQGQVEFVHEGSSSTKQFLKKMVSSDNVPLMRVRGDADVFFGSGGANVHLVQLEGDGLCVNGPSLLCFDGALTYDLARVQGAGMLSGGMWNTYVHGTGTAAVLTHGTPVILDCSQQPTYTDIDATVAWSANLKPTVQSSMNMRSVLRGGSGEAFQYVFNGPGWVIVQPYEPPPVPTR